MTDAVVATPPAAGATPPPADPAAAAGAAPPAAPPPAAPPADGTLLSGKGDDRGAGAASPATWPEDWRARLAGGDAAFVKTLDRFADPAALAKSYRELQTKLSSGQYKKALAADATPEEVATWRKEHGIPEAADKYEMKPPAGIVFGEDDKAALASFAEHAHAKNWTQDQFNQAIEWYGSRIEAAQAEVAEQDATYRAETHEALRSEWPGIEYRRNLNFAKSVLASAPEGLGDMLATARTTDGKLLGDHPQILAWLAQVGREIDPAATVVPAGTENAPKAIQDEINSLTKLMGDRTSDYWRGPRAQELQSRYRELVDAQARMSSRAA